jgi:hypothetical protein
MDGPTTFVKGDSARGMLPDTTADALLAGPLDNPLYLGGRVQAGARRPARAHLIADERFKTCVR